MCNHEKAKQYPESTGTSATKNDSELAQVLNKRNLLILLKSRKLSRLDHPFHLFFKTEEHVKKLFADSIFGKGDGEWIQGKNTSPSKSRGGESARFCQ